MISFRCPTCDHLLKVSPEKAGKKVKCNRCESTASVPEADGELTMRPEEPAPTQAAEEEEDDKQGYGLFVDPNEAAAKKKREEEEKRARRAKKEKDSHLPTLKKRIKTIYDIDKWKQVRTGLYIVMAGLGLWALQFLLHEVVVLVGIMHGPEYAVVVEEALVVQPVPEPEPGRSTPMDRMRFGVALVGGLGFVGLGRLLFILGDIFLLGMGGLFFFAYFLFRSAPDRFGTKTQVKTLMIIGGINLFVGVFLRLLPMIGLYNWPLFPLVLPEIAMNSGNIERGIPIHVFWLASPFWESILCFIFQFSFYLEPVMISVFLWSCGKQLLEHRIEENGQQVTKLGFGVYFIAFSYLIISLSGTSDMVVLILKVFYFLWIGFYVGYLIRYALVINGACKLMTKLIDATEAQEEATGEKKRTRKLSDDEDEDDDYDDDEEEDEDEDEDDDDDEDDDEDDDDEPPRRSKGRRR